jgi:hypothetical protein
VKTPAHIVGAHAKALERVRLDVNVAKFDLASCHRRAQPLTLPVHANPADRTFAVVPNG